MCTARLGGGAWFALLLAACGRFGFESGGGSGGQGGQNDGGAHDGGLPLGDALDGDALASCSAGTFGGHEYLFCNERLTFVDVDARCRGWGGHLVDIESQAEQDWLLVEANARLSLQTPSGAYTGGSDSLVENTWRWSSGAVFWDNGMRFGFTNGFNPDSSVGDEDHLELLTRNGGWNDLGSNAQRVWLCERP